MSRARRPGLSAIPALLGVARMGITGEIVLPPELREAAGLAPGRVVLIVGSGDGLALMDPDRALRRAGKALRAVRRIEHALGEGSC